MAMALCCLIPSAAIGQSEHTKDIKMLVQESCVDCHDADVQKGNIRLDNLPAVDEDPVSITTWLKVYDKVEAGEMPPKKKRFSEEEKNAFTTALSKELREFDAISQRTQGRVPLRRLSSKEYENIIRELLSVPGLDAAHYVPADSDYVGIDNVADMQELSYNQIAQYLEAAEASLQAAVALFYKPRPSTKRYPPKRLGAYRKAFRNAFTIADNKLTLIKEPVEAQGPWTLFTTPQQPGYYTIRLRAQSARISNNAFLPKKPASPKLLPGKENQTVAIGIALGRILKTFDLTPETDTYECKVWLHGGERLCIRCPDLPFRNTRFATGTKGDIWEAVAIEWAEIEGPLIEEWPPKGHQALFGNAPLKRWTPDSGYLRPRAIAAGTGEKRQPQSFPGGPYFLDPETPKEDSRHLLKAFMEKAYRRQVSNDEVTVMQKRVLNALDQKICFQDAMLIGYKAILCSPDFLFITEKPGRLSGNELANRLSLYLWRSLPDQRLINLGRSGELENTSTLLAEARRMLRDPKANHFIDDFADQWLELDAIHATAPDNKLYPEYYNDGSLVESLVKETRNYVREMVRNNLPASKIVDSDFTFLNERLAKHYNIPGVEGSRFRKVSLPAGSVRGGILTHGSMMKISANGFTTSPIKRGIWVLERILGTPPPPPPPNAGAIEPDTRGAVTIREQLEKHRAIESCAGCHRMIDPPGFALESFDVMGGYRTHYRSIDKGTKKRIFRGDFRFEIKLGLPVDATGEFSGKPFADINSFKKLIAKEDRQIARNILNRLLIHATGGIATFSDRAVLEKILDEHEAEGYGFQSLILSVLDTPMFLHK